MDPISLSFGVVGVVISLAVAWWQNRRAVRAEAELRDVLRGIPQQLTQELRQILAAAPPSPGGQTDSPNGAPRVLGYGDVDADNRQELVVWYPVGAHGSVVKTFEWQPTMGLEEGGQVASNTPFPGQIGDFDADGRPEIMLAQAGAPGDATARLFRVVYEWDGKKFAEVLREAGYPPTAPATPASAPGNTPSG